MEREYNVGTWLTPSDEYIKDIKQTLVEKGVATELTPNEELSEVVKKITTLKGLLDTTKSAYHLFFKFTGKNVDNLITYKDTENVTNMMYMFASCTNLTTIPQLNTSKVTTMESMFENTNKLKHIPALNYKNVTNMDYMFRFGGITEIKNFKLENDKKASCYSLFYDCKSLKEVDGLDLSQAGKVMYLFDSCSALTSIKNLKFPDNSTETTIDRGYFRNCTSLENAPDIDYSKLTSIGRIFYGCKKLKYVPFMDISNAKYGDDAFYNCSSLTELNIANIKINLKIGSGTSWGHLLTFDSLINACKECIKTSYSLTLTIGSANLEKLANVYVRFVDRTQTTIAVGEKGEVKVCEADNNDAMTIQEYMTLKNWTLA